MQRNTIESVEAAVESDEHRNTHVTGLGRIWTVFLACNLNVQEDIRCTFLVHISVYICLKGIHLL